MATATAKSQGKTEFVRAVLAKNKRANPKIVNEAWKSGGHVGTISTSLVQVARSEMGLTGNTRPGRKRSKINGMADLKSREGTHPKANGRHVATRVAQDVKAFAKSNDRTRVLAGLEGGIDEMIFKVKAVGGLHEFEEALRKARRILVRSHKE